MTGIGAPLRRLLVGVPFLWLLVFFLLPLLFVPGISLAEVADSVPPYRPLLAFGPGGLHLQATLANYRALAGACLRVYATSVGNAALATLLCLVLGYPIAWAIARAAGIRRYVFLFLVMLPFWTSFLIRVYAWIALLQPTGLLNRLLLALGLIRSPVLLLYNGFSVELGLVYSYLPFMILPLFGTLARLDETLIEAAADLGARPRQVFARIVLPLSLPGIAAGSLLVFIPAVGEFVIPDLLGGPRTLMVGKLLWQQFFDNVDWPAAAAIAVTLIVVLTLPLLLAQQLLRGEEPT